MKTRVVLPIPIVPDGFTFIGTGLNCFSTPKCIAAEGLLPGGKAAAYLALYLRAHYFPASGDATARTIRDAYSFPATAWYSLENRAFDSLSLKISSAPSGGGATAMAARVLARGGVPLIPVDKSALSFSPSYRKQSEPHLCVVTSHDPTRGVCTILTSEQTGALAQLVLDDRPIGDLWTEMQVPTAQIDRAHLAYGRNFPVLRGRVQYLAKRRAPADVHAVLCSEIETTVAAAIEGLEELCRLKFAALGALGLKEQIRFCNSQSIVGVSAAMLLEGISFAASARTELVQLGNAVTTAWKSAASARAVGQRFATDAAQVGDVPLGEVQNAEMAFLSALQELASGRTRPRISTTVEPVSPRGALSPAGHEYRFSSDQARKVPVQSPPVVVHASEATVARITAIWRDLLRLEEIQPDADWFELGGHSLLAVELLTRLRTEFRVMLPLRSIVERPSIRGLASLLEAASENTSS
jgi:acyl carrier protein